MKPEFYANFVDMLEKYMLPNIISLITFCFLYASKIPSHWYEWTLVVLIVGNVLGLRVRIRKKINPKGFKNSYL